MRNFMKPISSTESDSTVKTLQALQKALRKHDLYVRELMLRGPILELKTSKFTLSFHEDTRKLTSFAFLIGDFGNAFNISKDDTNIEEVIDKIVVLYEERMTER